MINVAPYIDHTILNPATVAEEVKRVCAEAVEYEFAAVCIPPPFVRSAKKVVAETSLAVATVIGFPFGYSVAAAKLSEIQQALKDGADELDIVANLSAIKSGSWQYLESEIKLLLAPVIDANKIVKIIVETGILTDEEILTCCRIYASAGVHFLKTSTGYAEKGASLHAVQLMRSNLPSTVKVKASGGIRSYRSAVEYINAGADRIGCSAGVAIMKEQQMSV